MNAPQSEVSEKVSGKAESLPRKDNENAILEEQQSTEDDGYPPKDGGRGAWTFLFGAAIVEVAAWAFPYTYGVFREYLFHNPPFEGQNVVSTVGVLANGMLQIVLPPVMYYLNNFPHQRKNVMWIGNIICCIAPLSGGFTTTAGALIGTLGVLYGVGAGLLFAPSIHLLNDWFDKKRSLAYGVICGAGALAGAVMPPIFAVCLENFGYKTTLIGWGLCSLLMTTIGLLCMHPRVPPTKAPKPSKKDFDFLRKPFFLIMLLATIVQALAHYCPSIYLPSFGVDYGLTAAQGSLLSTMLNLAQAIGQPLQGQLADLRKSFYTPMLVSTSGATISVLCIWGFAKSLWSLVLFSLAFGLTAGGFAVLRPRVSSATVGDEKNNEQSMLIFSILTALRGAAIIASGFISTSLVHNEYPVTGAWGGGLRYRDLLIFTAVLMFVASFGAGTKFISPHMKIGRKAT